MKKHSILAVVIISVLALVTSISITQYQFFSSGYTDNPQTEKAVKYLTNVMFVPSVGLDRCSPITESNTIWLTNDNILAYAVLLEFNKTIAETINQSLAEYGVSGNGLVELALNKTIEPIRDSNSYTIDTNGQYTIKMDVRNGSVMYDFDQYADLCFWWSQNLLLKNDTTGAIDYFNRGMSMWNGTGFSDKPFNGAEFQTYKVGLALWMAERLNYTTHGDLYQQTLFTNDNYSEMQNIIWILQVATNGGIHTGYNSTFETNSDTNVETTAICLLYQCVPQPITTSPTPTPTVTPSPTTPSPTPTPTMTPTPTPTPIPTPTSTPTPKPTQSTSSTPTATQLTAKPNTPDFILSLLIVLIVGASVAVAVLYKKKSKPKNTAKNTLP
jgi:hypothetical protein